MGFMDRFKKPKTKPKRKRATPKKRVTPTTKPIKYEGDLHDVHYKLDVLLNLLRQHDIDIKHNIRPGKKISSANMELKLRVLQLRDSDIPTTEIVDQFKDQVSKPTLYRWLKE